MTNAQPLRPQQETETEVIPPATSGDGIARTRELPVVEDEPTVVTPPPSAPTPPPSAPSARPSAPSAPPPSSSPPAVPARSRRPLLLAAVAAVAVLVVVAGVVALRGRGVTGSASGSSQSASVKLSSTITSFDPSGGSGFRRDGTAWRTQTYAGPTFGNLKEGVGLLLDLGASRAVSTVTLDAVGGPIAVELRAGDSESAALSGYQRLAADPSASGSTTLSVKDGAKHRYWLIWVTKLAPADGGYRAVIQGPTALGPRS